MNCPEETIKRPNDKHGGVGMFPVQLFVFYGYTQDTKFKGKQIMKEGQWNTTIDHQGRGFL